MLERPAGPPDGPFTGRLVAPGACITLPGPSEPADFFLFDVRAVLFAPLARGEPNGVVVLVDRSQIGPGLGTDQVALAYRITGSTAERAAEVERRLKGAPNAAAVRRVLAAR